MPLCYRSACLLWMTWLVACAPRSALRADTAWKDASPHRTGTVTVSPGVELEYLDWGGSGEPVVLLAGLGNTAHLFDDFAPRLASRFHVLALTRRGFGASSKPESGYDLRTRVEDLRQALDALQLDRVSLIGHSVAGDELTAFAGTYPARVHKLVYLEAGYDHTAIDALTKDGPTPSGPSPEDMASPAAVIAWQSRLLGFPVPEAEVRSTNVFADNGSWTGDVTPGFVYEQLSQGNARPDYSRVRAPTLAYYVVEESPEVVFPWSKALDVQGKEKLAEVMRAFLAFGKAERDRFREEVPGARVIELRGTHHYFFLTRASEVVPELTAFLREP